jgi:hypothetical protein
MRITNGLISNYSEEDLDNVATDFLRQFCPEALEKPMPIPIKTIMTKKLGLSIKHRRLTEDFSVYGLTCFNTGQVEIYNGKDGSYCEIPVKRGTIIIDPDTIIKRSKGCYFNTLAHETVHWWKHRNYQMLQRIIEYRYKVQTPRMREQCQTEEDWMEWQAENIAPRILMPIDMFTQKFYNIVNQDNGVMSMSAVAKQLSEFFKVSKESTLIRLREAYLCI